MLLSALLKDIGEFDISCSYVDYDINKLTLDNRQCEYGSAFFAIRGLKTDGHKYVDRAYKNGAVVAFVEEFVQCDILQVKVKDTRAVMSVVAAAFYGNPAHDMRFFGVTGTNGKTSITFMLRSVLENNGNTVGVIGTNGIYAGSSKLDIKISTSTTPDPIELQYILSVLKNKGVDTVVMEVTAQALYLRKVEDIFYDAAIFTNLTQDHLDFFGTIDVYKNAKKLLFDSTKCGSSILNTDDACGREIAVETNCKVITYGIKSNADFMAKNIVLHGQSCSFDVVYKSQSVSASLKITGMFNVYNALGAIAALVVCGMDLKKAVDYMSNYNGTPGRYETPDMKGKPFSVIIDYAHTPDGLENLLSTVNGYKQGRLITVFGCGGDRDALKRPIMGDIAAKYSDFCVITSDNPRFEVPLDIINQIEAGISAGFKDYIKQENRYEAIKYAMTIAKRNDIIVIAGKGDEDYQEINGVKHHFSDREVVSELLDII